ncbi:hypothetical protein COO60DRAFT_894298 [Scenedesmus sp. NREL 46B-D3]|nr:hypothetical protein COO60DRAFT_894298 [Scenedesmus sp. NREL 46B-D3]
MWLHQRALEYYYRIQRMQGVRLPNQVFTAEWRRPSGAVAVTPWHKYVQSLLCKYGVNVVTAEGRASACKSRVNKQVRTLPHYGQRGCRLCRAIAESLQSGCRVLQSVQSPLARTIVLVAACIVSFRFSLHTTLGRWRCEAGAAVPVFMQYNMCTMHS